MNGAFYRIDKFAVPEAAREEFLMNVLKTHEVLQAQEGFISHQVLEQVSGPGEFNFVTIAQ
jgi:heme-degrading monooxygenase HmoA